ncbi:hypothetical protein THAOC_30694, partial [Thalassiosira oceanica]
MRPPWLLRIRSRNRTRSLGGTLRSICRGGKLVASRGAVPSICRGRVYIADGRDDGSVNYRRGAPRCYVADPEKVIVVGGGGRSAFTSGHDERKVVQGHVCLSPCVPIAEVLFFLSACPSTARRPAAPDVDKQPGRGSPPHPYSSYAPSSGAAATRLNLAKRMRIDEGSQCQRYLNAKDAAALDAELMSTPGFSLEQ